jgi:hypothetical protein
MHAARALLCADTGRHGASPQIKTTQYFVRTARQGRADDFINNDSPGFFLGIRVCGKHRQAAFRSGVGMQRAFPNRP